jgi:hypothetical protein
MDAEPHFGTMRGVLGLLTLAGCEVGKGMLGLKSLSSSPNSNESRHALAEARIAGSECKLVFSCRKKDARFLREGECLFELTLQDPSLRERDCVLTYFFELSAMEES